jgi:hypothetical protein
LGLVGRDHSVVVNYQRRRAAAVLPNAALYRHAARLSIRLG